MEGTWASVIPAFASGIVLFFAFTKTLCDEDASSACTGRAIGSVRERDVARRTQQAACMKGEV
jgi:hypothetical protein